MSIVTINDENLKNIGNAIRVKTGSINKYKPSEMANAIENIKDKEPKLQEKTITPTTNQQNVIADSEYNGLSKVVVNAVTSAIDSDIKAANIKKGVNILGVNGTLEEGITPTGTKEITTNGNYDVSNFANANVNVPTGITPSGTKTITDNGDYDVTQYANAKVNVPKGITPSGTINITENGSYDITNYASAVVEVASTGGGGSTGGKYSPRTISFYNYKGEDLDYEIENLDTSNMTTMDYMFNGCSSLVSLDLSSFDTSNVTTMKYMFMGCSKLSYLTGLNTSNVTDMTQMFRNISSANLTITGLDTSKVTTMSNMFDTCGFTQFHCDTLNTSNVTNMKSMFTYCSKLTSIDLSNLNTNKVITMDSLFYGCTEITEIDMSSFTTGSLTSFYRVFYNCKKLQKVDLRNMVFATGKINSYADSFNNVPNDCLVIVKDNTQKSWLQDRYSKLTNIKTLEEYQAEGGV